jgi:hypothetical protein
VLALRCASGLTEEAKCLTKHYLTETTGPSPASPGGVAPTEQLDPSSIPAPVGDASQKVRHITVAPTVKFSKLELFSELMAVHWDKRRDIQMDIADRLYGV